MRLHLTLLFVALLSGVLACHGQVLPRSAQAGSTIAIPLGGSFSVNTTPQNMGFGGAHYTDYQRGQLVYRLGGPSGLRLETQVTVPLIAHPNSVDAFSGISILGTEDPPSGLQYFSLVRIPATAPTGNHELHVSRELIRDGQTQVVAAPSYAGTITILPNTVSEEMPEPATAQETELAWWDCTGTPCAWNDEIVPSGTVAGQVSLLVPRPEIRIVFDRRLWAAEVELGYPPGVIDVQDATEPVADRGGQTNDRASVWLRDDPGSQSARVSAAAQGRAFRSLSLVFTLNDGSVAVLEQSDLSVLEVRGYDQTGAVVGATSVSKLEIR